MVYLSLKGLPAATNRILNVIILVPPITFSSLSVLLGYIYIMGKDRLEAIKTVLLFKLKYDQNNI